jgi:uncharacterized protein
VTIAAIDVRDLRGRPGESRRVEISGEIEGLETEVARLATGINGDLLLESLVEGVFVAGNVAGAFDLRCARCLTEFRGEFAVEIAEMFVEHPDPDGDDYALDVEGVLDPTQMLCDAIGLEMPFSPLCRPDCQGLCPVCGGDRNRGECPGHAEVDPRWADLEQLFAHMDE